MLTGLNNVRSVPLDAPQVCAASEGMGNGF